MLEKQGTMNGEEVKYWTEYNVKNKGAVDGQDWYLIEIYDEDGPTTHKKLSLIRNGYIPDEDERERQPRDRQQRRSPRDDKQSWHRDDKERTPRRYDDRQPRDRQQRRSPRDDKQPWHRDERERTPRQKRFYDNGRN